MKNNDCKFIRALNASAITADPKQCVKKLQVLKDPQPYEIFELIFSCGKKQTIENKDTNLAKSNELAIFTDLVVIGITRLTQYVSKVLTSDWIERALARYFMTSSGQIPIEIGPWLKFSLLFCSEEMNGVMSSLFEAFRRLMNVVGLSPSEIGTFVKIISNAIFNVFQSLGVLPPGFTLDNLIKLFTKDVNSWSLNPTGPAPATTPWSDLCKKLRDIAEWRWDSWGIRPDGTKYNPADVAEDMIKDVWGKLLSGGIIGVTEVYSYVGQLMTGIYEYIKAHPAGTALTITAIIGIALLAFCVGTAGAGCVIEAAVAARVATAVLLICAAWGIDTSGWSASKISDYLQNGGA